MPKYLIIYLSLIALFFFNVPSFSQHEGHQSDVKKDKSEQPQMDHSNIKDKESREYYENLHKDALIKKTEYKNIWNKVCPVLGYKVDKKIKPVKYNGLEYGFCCKVCPQKFAAEPEKYSKNLSKDGKKFIGKKDR